MKKLIAILTTFLVLGIGATMASGSTVVRHTHRFVNIRTDTGGISIRLCSQCTFALSENPKHGFSHDGEHGLFRYRVRYPSGRVTEVVFDGFQSVAVGRERRP